MGTESERGIMLFLFRHFCHVLGVTGDILTLLLLKRTELLMFIFVGSDSQVSVDAHVHRVGRTGRAGQRGHAYSLLDPEVIDMRLQFWTTTESVDCLTHNADNAAYTRYKKKYQV